VRTFTPARAGLDRRRVKTASLFLLPSGVFLFFVISLGSTFPLGTLCVTPGNSERTSSSIFLGAPPSLPRNPTASVLVRFRIVSFSSVPFFHGVRSSGGYFDTVIEGCRRSPPAAGKAPYGLEAFFRSARFFFFLTSVLPDRGQEPTASDRRRVSFFCSSSGSSSSSRSALPPSLPFDVLQFPVRSLSLLALKDTASPRARR